MDGAQILSTFRNDLTAFSASGIVLVAYHHFLAYKVRHKPAYLVQAVNVIARTAWVESPQASRGPHHPGREDRPPVPQPQGWG